MQFEFVSKMQIWFDVTSGTLAAFKVGEIVF